MKRKMYARRADFAYVLWYHTGCYASAAITIVL